MRERNNDSEYNGLFAWGWYDEKRMKLEIEDRDSRKVLDEKDFLCDDCHAHFEIMDIGVMGSMADGCYADMEWIQLCKSCRDNEIVRLETILYEGKQDKTQRPKLAFLLKAKKSNG